MCLWTATVGLSIGQFWALNEVFTNSSMVSFTKLIISLYNSFTTGHNTVQLQVIFMQGHDERLDLSGLYMANGQPVIAQLVERRTVV